LGAGVSRLIDANGMPLGPPESFFGVDRSLPLLYGEDGVTVLARSTPEALPGGLAAWLPGTGGGLFAIDPAWDIEPRAPRLVPALITEAA
jgi:hypothetical protein